VLSRAIDQERAVRLVYLGASRDQLSERVVEPVELVVHAGRSYLAGWCREAGAARTFRLDRVRSVDILDEPVSGHSASQSVRPSLAEEVRLRVAPRSLWLLEGWDVTDVVEESDGGLTGVVHVADREWLIRIVLGQGGGVEVLSPPDLRSQVRAAAAAALASLTGS
ncbi:MAG: hypothetical protein RL347_1842, partial [Actinomycetota bacterium]